MGANLPTPFRTIFTDYAASTAGKSNQSIDINGAAKGQFDEVTVSQFAALAGVCNETAVAVDNMFRDSHPRVNQKGGITVSSVVAVVGCL